MKTDASCGWRPRLFSAEQMQRFGARPDGNASWCVAAYREFTSIVSHDYFPCPFAQRSLQLGTQWFVFLESLEPTELERLRASLLDYLHVSQTAAGKHRVLLPLVVMVRPLDPPWPLREYHRRGWMVLQYLHDRDVSEWPNDVPQDPEHYLWSFCFRGVQIFINFSSPAHVKRRSRHLGSAMAFVINARRNFDVVAGNNPEGDAVRRRVRARVSIYDGQPHGHDLGTYGSRQNREWRQYAAAEAGAPLPASCPLHLGSKPT